MNHLLKKSAKLLCVSGAVCSAGAVVSSDDYHHTSSSAHTKGSFLLSKTMESSAAATVSHKGAKSMVKNEKMGRDLISRRDNQMGSNVSVFYKQDGGLVVQKGEGVHLIDVDGNRHLDCCNNVAHVGHSHPTVVKAGCDGLKSIQTNSRFLNPVQQRYLDKLLSTFPPELNTVYLVNSGTEANDLAMRMARDHARINGVAKRPNDAICLESAYHGHSQAIVDISPYKWAQAVDDVVYQPESTHVVTLPDSFRGPHKGFTKETGHKYAEEIRQLQKATGGVGVFICESVIGCGGQIVPPPSYLKEVYEAVHARGGVCIADEVQTGFGRSGHNFWMFQDHGVVPDIVTCGKPMGNGYPVAAVICKRELADSFAASGIEYFNTYGGNAVACGIAEAVFDTIKDEGLQQNALEVGDYLQDQLYNLMQKYDCIGDVRGLGLFVGFELVYSRRDSRNLRPHAELTKFIVDHLKCEQIIISRDGPDENVIKVKPPIVFSKRDVDTLVSGVDRALKAAKKLGMY